MSNDPTQPSENVVLATTHPDLSDPEAILLLEKEVSNLPALPTVRDVVAELEALPIPPGQGKLIVFARNANEMVAAQASLVAWAGREIERHKEDLKEIRQNLNAAIKNKWRTEGYRRMEGKALKKVQTMEKVQAALELGYVIVPDMDADVFALRTTRRTPKGNHTKWNPADQVTNRPPLGEGRFVSNRAKEERRESRHKDDKGKEVVDVLRWAEEFRAIDFPFKLARPEVLEATSKAIKEKIFDQLTQLPGQRKRGDPMIIGEISYKEGYSEKKFCFVIAWFMDVRDLALSRTM